MRDGDESKGQAQIQALESSPDSMSELPRSEVLPVSGTNHSLILSVS